MNQDFPCRDSRGSAGRATSSSEHMKNLPLSHQLQLRRLFSHIKAHSEEPKPPPLPFTFAWSIEDHFMSLHSSRTNQLQWICRSCTWGRSKASARTTTWARAAPKSAPALLRQMAALRIGPQGRNNVQQMCQVARLPCAGMLLFLSCRVTSAAWQLAGLLTVSNEKHVGQQQQGNAV